MGRALIILTLPLALCACASAGDGAGAALKAGMGDALVAPLRDLNLMRKSTPEVLLTAAKSPYRLPDAITCETLAQEIAQLDSVLGPDIDTVASDMSLSLRGQQMASDAAVDAVEDLTTGWIPYRGLVRQVTGASKHQRMREGAERAGVIRRAYLKGMKARENCDGLGAPPLVQAAEESAAVVVAVSGPGVQ